MESWAGPGNKFGSGKFSNGANFRIIRKHATCAKIKITLDARVKKKKKSNECGRFEDGTLSFLYKGRVRTALCLVLSLLLLLKMPTRLLSSVPISVLKLPQSQADRGSPLSMHLAFNVHSRTAHSRKPMRITGSERGHSSRGFRQRHKKVSASGVFRVFATLLRDSLIKKGLLYAYSC